MSCLVCEKKIPLLRQLAGSPFCSKEHELRGAKDNGLAAAEFAVGSAITALGEGRIDSGAFGQPIPRYCDVILARQFLKPRYTMGARSGELLGWIPAVVPPGDGPAMSTDLAAGAWPRLLLAQALPNSLQAARLVAATSMDGMQPTPPPLAEALGCAGVQFRPTPWDVSLRTRWPGAHGTQAGLRTAHLRYRHTPSEQAPAPRFHASVSGAAPFAFEPAGVTVTPYRMNCGWTATQAAFPPSLTPWAADSSLRTSSSVPLGPGLALGTFGLTLAYPRLRGGETAFLELPNPGSANNRPRPSDGPLRPRQRMRGPGSRQYAPPRVGLAQIGQAAEPFAVAGGSPIPARLGFSPASPELPGYATRSSKATLRSSGCIGDTLPFADAARVQSPLADARGSDQSDSGITLPGPAGWRGDIVLPRLTDLPVHSPLQPSGVATLSALLGAVVAAPIGGLSPQFHLAPRNVVFDSVAAAAALQALSGISESFTMSGVEPALWTPALIPYRGCVVLPAWGPSGPSTPSLRAASRRVAGVESAHGECRAAAFEPAPFRYRLSIRNEIGAVEYSVYEDEPVWTAAGFCAEQAPAPLSGLLRSMYPKAAFSLYPVWLPALFSLNRRPARLPLARQLDPGAIGSAADSSFDTAYADGPGFSGGLSFPIPGAACGEFRAARIPRAAAATPAPRQRAEENLLMQQALRYWQAVPALARGLALSVPLGAVALLYAPKMTSPLPASSVSSLSAEIKARSMVKLEEDFRGGLGGWTGDMGWSVDGAGSAQPGRLALYRPSIPLTDYRLEFQGQIEAKGLGFVVRALDTNNYYATKLVIRKPGPQPTLAIVRYAVIEGNVEPKTEAVVPLNVQSDTLYNLLVTVEGEHFTVTVNGQLADAWSDSRLKSGGVGFFADKGEISHVRTVHLVDHEDFLGWLCSQVSHGTADSPKIGVTNE